VTVTAVAMPEPVDYCRKGQQNECRLDCNLRDQEQVRHWPRIKEQSAAMQPLKQEEERG